ncbi:MAG: zinc-dependent alcohol dehydrogenase family protein [Planctomycetota bacterium]
MRAVLYDRFGSTPRVENVQEPTPTPDGAVIEVRATGLCRSDWHGWQGHDPDIRELPHVPGHEFAGVVTEVGATVRGWRVGDRVTIPFVAGCGACPECRDGNPQVCDRQYQPGFSGWGSFAERVAVRFADGNLVALPEDVAFETAAALGCRFSTAYRAVALQGRLAEGDWIAVHGCGGVGLSAIMIARALGGRPIGVDVTGEALRLASEFGAEHVVDASQTSDVPEAIREITGRGAVVSIDALGRPEIAMNSVRCLAKRGRHVQVGLLVGEDAETPLPMDLVVARELEIVGSHGLQASYFRELLELVQSGRVAPSRLIRRRIALADAPAELIGLSEGSPTGMTMIDRFA